MTTVNYLDEVAASAPGRAYKSLLLDLMDLRPGQTVLDIGCGPGTDLGDLADAVTPSGRVIGLDRDPLMADHARVRHGGRPNVEIRVGDAAGMPFHDAGIDRARTDRMLQHVADPARPRKPATWTDRPTTSPPAPSSRP
jgi:ubiquinone/menaquinone biosynthesis C-methylase UbiE